MQTLFGFFASLCFCHPSLKKAVTVSWSCWNAAMEANSLNINILSSDLACCLWSVIISLNVRAPTEFSLVKEDTSIKEA